MKEIYENMICEVVKFDTADVITASDPVSGGGDPVIP